MKLHKGYQTTNGTYIIRFNAESLIYNKTTFKALKLSKRASILLGKIFTGSHCANSDPDFDKLVLALEAKGFIEDPPQTTRGDENSSPVIDNITTPHLNRVMIEITNACNLKCKHCYVLARKSKPQYLKYKTIDKLISEMEKIGVWQIDLTGGEISAHPEINKILNRLHRSHLLVNLFTNLSTGNVKFLDTIAAIKPKLVITSIDGNNATVHDEFRGVKGAFDRTFKNIKYLQSKNIPVRVNVSLSKYNYKHLEEIVYFIKNKIKAPFILGDIQCTDPATKEILLPRDDVIKSIVEYQSDIYLNRNKEKLAKSRKIHPACGVAFDFCFINSVGEVSLCPTLTKEENKAFYAGSILEDTIYNIWENSNAFKRYVFSQCEDIETCDLAVYCKGGCRSRAYLENKNINDRDPVNCSIVNKLFGNNEN